MASLVLGMGGCADALVPEQVLDDVEDPVALVASPWNDGVLGVSGYGGEAVEAVAQKHGLEAFGEEGEAFDPAVHEAMTSEPSDEVSEPTVAVVYQVGYRLGGRLLRPARVGVADTP